MFLTQLLLSLQVNSVDLALVEALEVVGLHSVRGQHAGLGGLVLSHKVMVISVFDFPLLLLGPLLVLLGLPIFLLFGKHSVD